jgi:hypothetical protein
MDNPIGTHLASLNLFREADGSLHITCEALSDGARFDLDGEHRVTMTVTLPRSAES